jgi:Pretoxin HINT domain
VWAADPETGEAGARPVTALIEGEGVKDLVTVSTGSGSVVATAGHPFWSVSDAAWVDAGELAVGDAVLEADGATSVVTAVSEVSRQAVVHNLTVADLHTYFVVVGDAPTLVHNCGGGSQALQAYDPNFALGQMVAGGRATASQLDEFGTSVGWFRSQTATGPIKFTDENAVVRLTIKLGSNRAPGSSNPHVEIRNALGQRVDPFGIPVTRTSPRNHTPIIWDLD